MAKRVGKLTKYVLAGLGLAGLGYLVYYFVKKSMETPEAKSTEPTATPPDAGTPPPTQRTTSASAGRNDTTDYTLSMQFKMRVYKVVCKPTQCLVEGRYWVVVDGQKIGNAQTPLKVYMSVDGGAFNLLPNVAICDGQGWFSYPYFDYPGDGHTICLKFVDEANGITCPTPILTTPCDWFNTTYYTECEDP